MTMKKTATAVLAAAALALTGCKHDGSTPGVASDRPQQPRATSPAIAELLAGVPGSAAAIAFVDLAETPWSQIIGGWLLPLDDATRQSLDKELREYLARTVGLDVSKLQYVVAFASGPPPHVAVLVKTVGGTLKLPPTGEHEGAKLWLLDPRDRVHLAIRGDVMILGDEVGVRDAVDTLAGKRKPVTVENKALVDSLRKDSGGAAFAFAAIKPKDLPLPPPIAGLDRVVVTAGAHGIFAAIDGDDATISQLQSTADQAFAMALAQVENAHRDALAGKTNPIEGAGAIIGAAYAKSFAARLKPRRTGNRLAASLDFGSTDVGPAVIPMIGILSAVAIPAFMDYMKRSKKTEAALQLNKVAKNAKRVYVETGKFPVGNAPLTPPQPCCGQPNNHCAAVPQLYAASPVWTMLDFQIDEPTLFQYSYRGSRDGQSFVAEAVGDLDCDGTFITYELKGSVTNGAPSVMLIEPAANAD
jgi:hypothetical protein